MKTSPPGSKKTTARGFSLVEVAIALGVMSFACSVIVNMLPICLGIFHQATENTVESQIVQSIANDLQNDSFSSINNSALISSGTNYYYDNEGALLSSSAGNTYQAVVTVKALSSSNSPLSPASSGTAGYNIVVTIQNAGQQSTYDLQHRHMYCFVVANNGS